MKKSNKGFSLVELIIVIAIMAILAAAIAPALIRYIDKSRKADDIQFFGQIQSAASAALANEEAYTSVSANMGTANPVWTGTVNASGDVTNPTANTNKFEEEVNSTLGSGNKLKYVKGCTANSSITVLISADEKIHVSFDSREVVPSLDPASSWK